jgi:hypothetical protein
METNNEQPSIFDGFVRNTIIFYLLLIIVGYLSNLTYYKLFDFDISGYLVVEDYTNIFFNNLYLLIIMVGYYFFSYPAILHFRKKRAESRILRFPNEADRGLYIDKKIKKFKTYTTVISNISLLTFLVLYLIYDFSNNINVLRFLIGFSWVPLTSVAMVYLDQLEEFKLIKVNAFRLALVLAVISLSWMKYYYTFRDGYKLLTSTTNLQKMTFNLDTGKTIITSDSTLYLGLSKDYIFLYNKLRKKTLIYNKSTIKLIESVSIKKH